MSRREQKHLSHNPECRFSNYGANLHHVGCTCASVRNNRDCACSVYFICTKLGF
ncbi:unnamed protein product [Moneuplotes crassus]|uniref:Uncharacterized protein n=1 Tax=Euplotes crassus TaxID=5936 RepID=A0AAD1XHA8_EUPCR|nr:unnamed protein product [Moneuplotes crassus]